MNPSTQVGLIVLKCGPFISKNSGSSLFEQPADLQISVLLQGNTRTFKIDNSPHKLSFQISMWVGDQKLRYDLVWPKI